MNKIYIYILWFIDTVIYVGRSRQVRKNRLAKHHKDKNFDEIQLLGPYPLNIAKALEKGLIEDLHPIHNIQYNSDNEK